MLFAIAISSSVSLANNVVLNVSVGLDSAGWSVTSASPLINARRDARLRFAGDKAKEILRLPKTNKLFALICSIVVSPTILSVVHPSNARVALSILGVFHPNIFIFFTYVEKNK